ncbi:MAG: S26 family signal peptidase [Paracoccaceae bacterium]|nr:S26 family signal peptidase [Paracoccaceae bacterium]MDG2259953.1 S26 family signal peptidase [Paracoccaceae bacterium]
MSRVKRSIGLGLLGGFVLVGFYTLSAGTLVINGTSSLPHSGYVMLRWPIVPLKGSYIAFRTPVAVDDRFQNFPFVKRVAGRPGDKITSTDTRVCIADDCRSLLGDLTAKGLRSLPSGKIGDDQYVVFGDAPDSLDSRYALIGTVAKSDILAVGFPVPIPHWTELHAWFQ